MFCSTNLNNLLSNVLILFLQVLILEVIVSCTKLEHNCQLLLEKYGLLAWLSSVIQCFDFGDTLVPPVITTLLSVIKYKTYTQRVVELLFIAMRKYRLSVDQLMHIVRVLHQYKNIVHLTEPTANELVEIVSSTLDKQHAQHIQRCKNILMYGADYQLCVEEPVETVRQLKEIILAMYRRLPPKVSEHSSTI